MCKHTRARACVCVVLHAFILRGFVRLHHHPGTERPASLRGPAFAVMDEGGRENARPCRELLPSLYFSNRM